jgi:hypothetical protein
MGAKPGEPGGAREQLPKEQDVAEERGVIIGAAGGAQRPVGVPGDRVLPQGVQEEVLAKGRVPDEIDDDGTHREHERARPQRGLN